MEVNGIKFKCFCAGHVLGAAMFQVEIDGVRVLYTGDYSTEEERLIMPAEIPTEKVDILIVESTYGCTEHESRAQREKRFTNEVFNIVSQGGKCLLPVIASGRAEELLLILEEFWEVHPELQEVAIHYTSALFQKFKEIFQYYINLTPKNNLNLFNLHFAPNRKTKIEDIRDDRPCVVMTCPGMLQSGISLQLYKKWCEDERSGVILTGYCAEGTLAAKLKNNPHERLDINGREVTPKMKVATVPFSAHADYKQTSNFISQIEPDYVVLVHGHQKKATELLKKLTNTFQGKIKRIVAPGNTQEETFWFDGKKGCKIIGELEKQVQEQISGWVQNVKKLEENKQNSMEEEKVENVEKTENMEIEGENTEKKTDVQDPKAQIHETQVEFSGLLVQDEDNLVLIKQNDESSTCVKPKKIQLLQKMIVPYAGSLKLIQFFALEIFNDGVIQLNEDLHEVLIIKQSIQIHKIPKERLAIIEWMSSVKNDIIVDHFAMLLQQFKDNDNLDMFQQVDSQNSTQKEQNYFCLIKNSFPESQLSLNDGLIMVKKDDAHLATIDFKENNIEIHTNDLTLQARLQALYDNIKQNI